MTWSKDELSRIADADDLHISSSDGKIVDWMEKVSDKQYKK
jgi:hypothetical protein